MDKVDIFLDRHNAKSKLRAHLIKTGRMDVTATYDAVEAKFRFSCVADTFGNLRYSTRTNDLAIGGGTKSIEPIASFFRRES